MVSYRVARTGKPHTIVEDLILPTAADMAGTMLGEKAPKNYTDSAFINTVSRGISDMAGDVLKQLLLHTQATELHALQLDESADVAGPGTARGVCPLCLWGSIKEDILFWKPGQHERIFFKVLDSFVISNGL